MTLPRPRLALALLALLPFGASLFHPFFADDFIHLERLRNGAGVAGLLQAWVLRAADSDAWWSPPDLAVVYFRPLLSASLLLDHALWGLRPFGYHLTNLLLHAAATVLVYEIARRLTAGPTAAWAAAGLFALHPCHAEAVLWVSGRTDVLSGAFALASFLFYLRAREGGARGAWLAASAGALAAALLAKEMAASLPLLMLLDAWLRPDGETWRRRLVPPLLAAVAVAAVFALRRWAVGALVPPPYPFAHWPGDPGFLGHVLRAPVLYLADLVLFVPPDPVVTEPFWRAHPAGFAVLAALAAAVFVSSLRSARNRTVVAFGLGWIALTLLPVLPLSVGERFLYLPSVGYCLVIGAKAERMLAEPRARAWRPVALTAAVVLLVSLVRTTAMGWLATRAEAVRADALAALRSAPGTSLLMVVDLPGVATLGFGHALRLAYPGPLRVEILSLTGGFAGASTVEASELINEADGSFVVRRAPAALGTYLERAFRGERGPLRPGEVVTRPDLTVTVVAAPRDLPESFRVRLRDGGAARPLLLRGTPDGLQPAPLLAAAQPVRPIS